MPEQKTKIHPDARKAMARFAAEPIKAEPLTDADTLLGGSILNTFIDTDAVTSCRESADTRYSGTVDLQVSMTRNAKYTFPDSTDTRTELHKRAKRAFSHKAPAFGKGVKMINTVSDELQLRLAHFDTREFPSLLDHPDHYVNSIVSDFVKLCESLGMMNYCHKILAKHNLDI